MALDRELVSVMVARDLEIVKNDIRRMIATAIETHPGRPPELYRELGTRLVVYNGIGGRVLKMANLVEMFVRLGQDVAFVVHEMDDAGMFYEEPFWLGAIELSFDFADRLKKLPAIQDCSERERLVLYTHYLIGLQRGSMRFYKEHREKKILKS